MATLYDTMFFLLCIFNVAIKVLIPALIRIFTEAFVLANIRFVLKWLHTKIRMVPMPFSISSIAFQLRENARTFEYFNKNCDDENKMCPNLVLGRSLMIRLNTFTRNWNVFFNHKNTFYYESHPITAFVDFWQYSQCIFFTYMNKSQVWQVKCNFAA